MQVNELSQVLETYYQDDKNLRINKQFLKPSLERLILALTKMGYSNSLEVERKLAQEGGTFSQTIEQHLVCGEDQFFAGYGMFRGLEKVIIPRMLEQYTNQKTVSVWVPNCGRGYEVYSVIIELLFHLQEQQKWSLSVTATDTDRERLEFAEKSMYSTEHILSEHFMKYNAFFKKGADDEFTIKKSVRQLVNFAYDSIFNHNSEEGYELVVFRGFLKYYTPEFQRKIITSITNNIKPYGYLVLNVDESLLGLTRQYKIVDSLRGFYQKLP